MTPADAVKRYRHHAEEFRAKAAASQDAGMRESYFKMAETYEQLAESEVRLIRVQPASRAA